MLKKAQYMKMLHKTDKNVQFIKKNAKNF